ncbi:hypothetical protein AB0C98_28950 [Streptomyces sp. NPDC048558]|uniref:hypothetical protein n=1 Tax=Streptomyces sp. NPDC048558 TaxID=3155759 RepID=UPI00344826C1
MAVSVLAALAPSQAFAAPQAPPCTKKNVAYLDAQDRQEDAEAKVTVAEKALDQARADRAKLDKAAGFGDQLVAYMQRSDSSKVRNAVYSVHGGAYELHNAASKHDPVATADAAVKLADATDKALTDAGVKDTPEGRNMRAGTTKLRTLAEDARKATEAPNVETRQSELDTARSELTDAAKTVRPARDAYRDCLDKLVN